MYRVIEIETGDCVIFDPFLANIASLFDSLNRTYPGCYKLEWDDV